MKSNFDLNKDLNLIKAVKSESDNSLREKPYARLKEGYKLDSNIIDAEDYLIESCEKRGIWPIELLLQQFGEKQLVDAIDYITDCGDRAKFDPPRNLSELRTEKCAYFAGVAAGDGGFNGPKTWSVVDGGKEHQLEHSQEFIEKIGRIMQDLFGFEKKSIWINKRDNRVELKITNKWFSRYIRYVFGLPKSYKKGKLSRPDIFQSQENIAAFWRGVFDTDGSIAEQSYRVSLSSATRSFLEECRNDLEAQNISVREIRKPSSYLLRLENGDFNNFCEAIGFLHPRKREKMAEKLKKGSRNYVYKGRKRENINDFYDLTQIEELRVKGIGNYIKRYREKKDLYQRDLAKEIGVSRTQIYYWENNIYAAPLSKIVEIAGNKEEAWRLMEERQVKYKAGVRGNENSEVNLPLSPTSEIDGIASKIVCTEDEIRIRNRSETLAASMEDIFDVNVERRQDRFCIRNYALVGFFSRFYRYEPKFCSYQNSELKAIKRRHSL